MREPMHPIYTMIPQRSFDAYVSRSKQLKEILCALIVDPDEAHDAALEYGVQNTPHQYEDFKSLGMKSVEKMLSTISLWARNRDSREAMADIVDWNMTLGLWCGCSVARMSIQFADAASNRPRLAIEKAESLIRSKGNDWNNRDLCMTAESIMDLGQDLEYMARDQEAMNAAFWATYAAAYALGCVCPTQNTDSATFASSVPVSVANAFSYGNPDLYATDAYYSMSRILSDAIADACLKFPR